MIHLAAKSQTWKLRKGGGTWGLGLGTLVAESAEESRQAVTVSRHVVTRAAAVHTLRARLAAVVSIKARGTN